MTSRSMMRSVSAPAADVAPPESVALVLRSTPFKSSSTRRDLTTSYRGFKAAWTAIEQVQVLSQSCRRLGERAADVLMAVREKLEEVEKEETLKKGGKVVLDRSYEFQSGKAGGELAGKTVFKIQSYVRNSWLSDSLRAATVMLIRLMMRQDDARSSSFRDGSPRIVEPFSTRSPRRQSRQDEIIAFETLQFDPRLCRDLLPLERRNDITLGR